MSKVYAVSTAYKDRAKPNNPPRYDTEYFEADNYKDVVNFFNLYSSATLIKVSEVLYFESKEIDKIGIQEDSNQVANHIYSVVVGLKSKSKPIEQIEYVSKDILTPKELLKELKKVNSDIKDIYSILKKVSP
jgi:hypothetical protein